MRKYLRHYKLFSRQYSVGSRQRNYATLVFAYCLLLTVNCVSLTFAQQPSGEEILKRIDKNFRAANRVSVTKMIIHGRRASRTVKAKSWIQGIEKSFTEYLAPAREKGIKMLKLKDQLWTYSPSTDRTIKISGHMLRQSVMGSDLSYEDFMEDPELHKIYIAENVGEEILGGRPCWVLVLTAAKKDIAYFSRKIWVDKERYLPLKENRYAKSGKLLKTTEVKEVMKVENRWVFKHVIFKDVLKKGNGTEFFMESVQFDVDIPGYVFSKAALRK